MISIFKILIQATKPKFDLRNVHDKQIVSDENFVGLHEVNNYRETWFERPKNSVVLAVLDLWTTRFLTQSTELIKFVLKVLHMFRGFDWKLDGKFKPVVTEE